jgi:hypothetical protein
VGYAGFFVFLGFFRRLPDGTALLRFPGTPVGHAIMPLGWKTKNRGNLARDWSPITAATPTPGRDHVVHHRSDNTDSVALTS